MNFFREYCVWLLRSMQVWHFQITLRPLIVLTFFTAGRDLQLPQSLSKANHASLISEFAIAR